MATPATGATAQTTPETLIIVKVAVDGNNRKFKIPLKELNAASLPKKLRSMLQIAEDQQVVFERFSDSSGTFITLDANNPSTYKQLYRAAKAKLKLRLKVTLVKSEQVETASTTQEKSTSIETQGPQPVTDVNPIEAVKPLPEILQPEPAKVMSIGNTVVKDPYAYPPHTVFDDTPGAAIPFWQVFCNSCDKILSDAHFHCGICDKGDYDLCEECVDSGKLCEGEDHWLIKRFIKDGTVVNSTTEKVAPKPSADEVPQVPGSFTAESKVEAAAGNAKRTCNGCVRVLPEDLLMTCKNCPDYDLCVPCSRANQHGHHPGHTFKAVVPGSTKVDGFADFISGGRTRHQAICDGCDQTIVGVRHKCLECPDFDYCGPCHSSARTNHPGHRFAPIYERLSTSVRSYSYTTHHGIYCDGPLCAGLPNQHYIRGIRYKCAICHDTDFCANCEAAPDQKHNVTHPLIMFKTEVRGASIQTTGDNGVGQTLPAMGDRISASRTSPVAASVKEVSTKNASTETLPRYTPTVRATPSKSLLQTDEDFDGLDAHFVRDRVPDGAKFAPGTEFYQTWIVKNPGPKAWPMGCSVKFVGGDFMLAVDRTKAISMAELEAAQQSNTRVLDLTAEDPQIAFTVKLRAPAREGKHISYWRLKTPNGVAFGHKLWCDIDVTTKATGTQSTSDTFDTVLEDNKNLKQEIQEVATPSFRRPAQQMRAMFRDRERAMRVQRSSAAAAAAGKAWAGPSSTDSIVAERSESSSAAATDFDIVNKSNLTRTLASRPLDLASVEHSELRDLVEKQRKRRESTEGASMDAEAKASIMQACAVADNQEARALIDRQQKRRQAMRSGTVSAMPTTLRQTPNGPASSSPQSATGQESVAQLAQRRVEAWGRQRELMQQRMQQQQRIQQQQQQQQAGMRQTQQWKDQTRLNEWKEQVRAQTELPIDPQPWRLPSRVAPFGGSGTTVPLESYPELGSVDHLRQLEAQNSLRRRKMAQMGITLGSGMTLRSSATPPPVPAKEPHAPMPHHEAAAGTPFAGAQAVEAKPADSKIEPSVEARKPKPATVEDAATAEDADTDSLSTSQMVFPTLEKDGSPAASTHEDAPGKPIEAPIVAASEAVAASTGPDATSASLTSAAKAVSTTAGEVEKEVDETTTAGMSDDEEFEDVSNVDFYNDVASTADHEVKHEEIDSEDEGFETDEYDILDASDEEITHVGRGAF